MLNYTPPNPIIPLQLGFVRTCSLFCPVLAKAVCFSDNMITFVTILQMYGLIVVCLYCLTGRLYKLVVCRCHNKECMPPQDLNMESDEPYSAVKFRIEMTFHLPCAGLKRLRRYKKHSSRNGELSEKIEMDVDIDCDTTQGLNTAITATTPE